MGRSAQDFQAQLQALQPPGAALPQDMDSTWGQFLAALAGELARVDARSDDLLDEVDPRSTLELLPDWERVCALPDACTGDATTLQERRRAVVRVLTARGGQSPAYFQAVASELGYSVIIEEFRPFIAGASRCGDVLNGPATVRHTWRVRVLGPRVTWFRAGASRCGDLLGAIARAQDLECVLGRLAPAHTHLIVAYEED
ncbi:YmfQ family protein [Desulfocurvus vexinensis]|uniref:YmfQ family protein n=1 Tax=Desulfocurvus vexinensis TaxID=399548 RepID=UPI00048AFDC9|nr:putative phage tail protein [Desulfocurvus vexinensis]